MRVSPWRGKCPNCGARLDLVDGRIPRHTRQVRAGFCGHRPVRCAGSGREIRKRTVTP